MSSPTQISAVLFDIDGTLVDSNYLHADAWHRAFAAAGRPVDAWRIHRAIGMDSGKLLDRLLGDDADRLGEAARQRHGVLYRETADRLRPFAGAVDLLEELARRGRRVVLATSAPGDELEILLGVLGSIDGLTAVTSAEDAGTAKPDPDIIRTAVERASASAARSAMVGDSVWDMEAAGRAGVVAIGVLSGGTSREELLAAGAAEVYEDVADLLAHLDGSLIG